MDTWKKQFAIIYAGQAFSLIGSAAVQFAIIWWLTIQTESAVTLTIAAIVSFIPNMVIGPFAGIWIDRYNRRTIMMAADGLVALSSVFLAAAFLFMDTVPIWFVYGILFLRGLGASFHLPAMQAAIPMLVPPEMLVKAGGWGNLINSVSSMIGPVIGAAMMGAMHIASIMLVDIFGAALAIISLLFVRIPDVPQNEQKPDALKDMKQGFAAIRSNKPLVTVLPTLLLCNVISMPLGTLFPLLVRTHFGGEALHNSMCELLFAGGLLVSSIVMGVWGGMKKRFLMVSMAIGLFGIISAIGGLLPPSGFWWFVICCFFMGGCGTFINVPFMAYIQETTAPEMMGKVLSLLMSGITLAMPLGLLVAGPVSEFIGIDKWFAYSGVLMMLTGVLCWIRTRRIES